MIDEDGNEMETEEQMCERWAAWCSEQGLKCMSADEFALHYNKVLTFEQKMYVLEFIQDWEKLMKALYP